MTFFGRFGLGAGAALLRKGAQFRAGLFREIALKKHEGKTIIYKPVGSEWQEFETVERKPLDLPESAVLANGISERIVNDCWKFINNPSWFSERGISPYRRGYLLHSPWHGLCGRTTYITALAGELERDICVFNLSDRDLTDDGLDHLLAVAPQQTIILLKDIDTVFTSRTNSKKVKAARTLRVRHRNDGDKLSRVTFSGLLNCLDCVASTESRILFMTTNYIDRLDPKLLGTGRADVIEYIGMCSESHVEKIFLRFYKESSLKKDDLGKLAKEFAHSVISDQGNIYPAIILQYLSYYESDPDAAVKNVTSDGITLEEVISRNAYRNLLNMGKKIQEELFKILQEIVKKGSW